MIGDESFFDALRIGPGWKPYYFLNESPALSALTVDRGRYRGYLTRQPALAAAMSFRAALVRAGISVAGRAMTRRGGDAAEPPPTSRAGGCPQTHGPTNPPPPLAGPPNPPLRVLDHPERAALDLLGAASPGPFRGDPSRAVARRGLSRRRSARPRAAPSRASSPAPRR